MLKKNQALTVDSTQKEIEAVFKEYEDINKKRLESEQKSLRNANAKMELLRANGSSSEALKAAGAYL